MPITIVDHDPDWVRRFEVERAAIVAELGASALRVEHIGSTAVPELAAKPIVDMLLVLPVIPADPSVVAALQQLGYAHHGEHGISQRAYFTKGEPRTHHIHAFAPGDANIERHLLFRDYLRRHPDDAERYVAVKRGLAESGLSGNAYADAKSAFVAEIVARAREPEAAR
jgi:GrpB-like predicted nucleotidyltransferase (UPF0157 family)